MFLLSFRSRLSSVYIVEVFGIIKLAKFKHKMVDNTKSNKTKAKYFLDNNFKSHIKVKPTGSMDGYFKSELIDNIFYWFETLEGKKEMLFLLDIYEIKIYEGRTDG